MRISDWSSDVCSSDLWLASGWWQCADSCGWSYHPRHTSCKHCGTVRPETTAPTQRAQDMADYRQTQAMSARTTKATLAARSGERRDGKASVSTCECRV